MQLSQISQRVAAVPRCLVARHCFASCHEGLRRVCALKKYRFDCRGRLRGMAFKLPLVLLAVGCAALAPARHINACPLGLIHSSATWRPTTLDVANSNFQAGWYIEVDTLQVLPAAVSAPVLVGARAFKYTYTYNYTGCLAERIASDALLHAPQFRMLDSRGSKVQRGSMRQDFPLGEGGKDICDEGNPPAPPDPTDTRGAPEHTNRRA